MLLIAGLFIAHAMIKLFMNLYQAANYNTDKKNALLTALTFFTF